MSYNNQMSGTIPSEVCNLMNSVRLYVNISDTSIINNFWACPVPTPMQNFLGNAPQPLDERSRSQDEITNYVVHVI